MVGDGQRLYECAVAAGNRADRHHNTGRRVEILPKGSFHRGVPGTILSWHGSSRRPAIDAMPASNLRHDRHVFRPTAMPSTAPPGATTVPAISCPSMTGESERHAARGMRGCPTRICRNRPSESAPRLPDLRAGDLTNSNLKRLLRKNRSHRHPTFLPSHNSEARRTIPVVHKA